MKYPLLSVCVLLLLCFHTSAQTMVSTVVDNPNFTFSDDLTFDAAGNLYCADYSGQAVYKRTPGGVITEFVGGMNTPNGLAFNSSGELYVCDNIGNRIYVVDQGGNYIDTVMATSPSGLVKMAASDTMIFTTYGAEDALKKLAPDGSISNLYSGAPLNGPVGLEYCGGDLYIANFNDRKIFRLDGDTVTEIAQLPGSGYLGFITCVDDQLLATAFNGQKIYKVDPSTQTVGIYAGSTFGGTDGALDSAKFTTPNGIVANPAGDTIYISEYNTGKLRAISGFTLHTTPLFASAIQAYPNPMTEQLIVALDDMDHNYTVHLTDMRGIEVQSMVSDGQEKLILDVSTLDSGVFLLTVKVDGTVKAVEKVIKRN